LKELPTNPYNNSYTRVTPVRDNILVEVVKDEKDAVTAGGILLAADKKVSVYARVVEVGPEVTINVSRNDVLEFGDSMVRPNVSDEDGKMRFALVPQSQVMGVYRYIE
jgi:co-chaperonin GroES (HSP10)